MYQRGARIAIAIEMAGISMIYIIGISVALQRLVGIVRAIWRVQMLCLLLAIVHFVVAEMLALSVLRRSTNARLFADVIVAAI